MLLTRLLRKLYLLTVSQSLMIVSILTLPVIIFLSSNPVGYKLAKTLANFAIIYFAIAFLLYLFLYGISHLPISRTRKRLVTFTRIYIRFHIAVAIVGTIFITLHATLMLSIIPITSQTAITGLLTLISLIGVLFTGFLRKRKSSGKRRRFHRYVSFLFVSFLVIHLVI
jgi:cation transport ATPase